MSQCVKCPKGTEGGQPGHETSECRRYPDPCAGCNCTALGASVCLRRAANTIAVRFEAERG